MESLAFARPFQLWLYTVSHGQLLLRSNRSQSFQTRIDILFKDVATLELPTFLTDLQIDRISGDSDTDRVLGLRKQELKHRKLYLLSGHHYRGHIIAGALAWHEDDGSYSDPSHFQSSLGPFGGA